MIDSSGVHKQLILRLQYKDWLSHPRYIYMNQRQTFKAAFVEDPDDLVFHSEVVLGTPNCNQLTIKRYTQLRNTVLSAFNNLEPAKDSVTKTHIRILCGLFVDISSCYLFPCPNCTREGVLDWLKPLEFVLQEPKEEFERYLLGITCRKSVELFHRGRLDATFSTL